MMRLTKIIGLIFLAASLLIFINRMVFINHAQKAEGKVVFINDISRTDIQPIGKGGITTTFTYPTVEFQVNGQKYNFEGSIIASYLNLYYQRYQMGQTIEILYDTNQPSKVLINNFTEIWILPLLLLGLGVVFLILIPLLITLMVKLLNKDLP